MQIEFVDVCRRADERWRHPVAGHEKGGVVKGVANADVTVAGDDGVIVKDMVGCDQKRKRLVRLATISTDEYDVEGGRECYSGKAFTKSLRGVGHGVRSI